MRQAWVFLGVAVAVGCSRPWQGPEWDRIDATTRADTASGAALAGVPDPRVPSTAGVRGDEPIEILPIEVEPDIEPRRPVVVTSTATPAPVVAVANPPAHAGPASAGLAPAASLPFSPPGGASSGPSPKGLGSAIASNVDPPVAGSLAGAGVSESPAALEPPGMSRGALPGEGAQQTASNENSGNGTAEKEPASKSKASKSKGGKKSAQGRGQKTKKAKKSSARSGGKKKQGKGKSQASASGAPNLAEKLAKHVRIGLTASGGRGSRGSGSSSSGLRVKPRISITL